MTVCVCAFLFGRLLLFFAAVALSVVVAYMPDSSAAHTNTHELYKHTWRTHGSRTAYNMDPHVKIKLRIRQFSHKMLHDHSIEAFAKKFLFLDDNEYLGK